MEEEEEQEEEAEEDRLPRAKGGGGQESAEDEEKPAEAEGEKEEEEEEQKEKEEEAQTKVSGRGADPFRPRNLSGGLGLSCAGALRAPGWRWAPRLPGTTAGLGALAELLALTSGKCPRTGVGGRPASGTPPGGSSRRRRLSPCPRSTGDGSSRQRREQRGRTRNGNSLSE
jgi:hypothetical protein